MAGYTKWQVSPGNTSAPGFEIWNANGICYADVNSAKAPPSRLFIFLPMCHFSNTSKVKLSFLYGCYSSHNGQQSPVKHSCYWKVVEGRIYVVFLSPPTSASIQILLANSRGSCGHMRDSGGTFLDRVKFFAKLQRSSTRQTISILFLSLSY